MPRGAGHVRRRKHNRNIAHPGAEGDGPARPVILRRNTRGQQVRHGGRGGRGRDPKFGRLGPPAIVGGGKFHFWGGIGLWGALA